MDALISRVRYHEILPKVVQFVNGTLYKQNDTPSYRNLQCYKGFQPDIMTLESSRFVFCGVVRRQARDST